MAIPLRMQLAVFQYIVRCRIQGVKRYPLVLMLEPLFACNLECAGCGKIQYPPEVLKRRLTPEECWEAALECGAPIVSVAGGEPLAHERIQEIVDGLIARGKYVYLCTNALLLDKHLQKFRPSSQLVFNVHLDGPEAVHDRNVGKPGAYQAATTAIRRLKKAGFHVTTNTTVFQGSSAEGYRRFFDDCMALGVDGMTIAPGYAYEKAGQQGLFLKPEQTKAWFREAFRGRHEKGWVFNHSPFYLDFLEGKRDYDCTPWGTPLRNLFGWQRPCYLMAEGEYAKSYRELQEATDWNRFGPRSGHPNCANCMMHSGFEPSAVIEAFSSAAKFLELARDYVAPASR